jgi:hypothetical protein
VFGLLKAKFFRSLFTDKLDALLAAKRSLFVRIVRMTSFHSGPGRIRSFCHSSSLVIGGSRSLRLVCSSTAQRIIPLPLDALRCG